MAGTADTWAPVRAAKISPSGEYSSSSRSIEATVKWSGWFGAGHHWALKTETSGRERTRCENDGDQRVSSRGGGHESYLDTDTLTPADLVVVLIQNKKGNVSIMSGNQLDRYPTHLECDIRVERSARFSELEGVDVPDPAVVVVRSTDQLGPGRVKVLQHSPIHKTSASVVVLIQAAESTHGRRASLLVLILQHHRRLHRVRFEPSHRRSRHLLQVPQPDVPLQVGGDGKLGVGRVEAD